MMCYISDKSKHKIKSSHDVNFWYAFYFAGMIGH